MRLDKQGEDDSPTVVASDEVEEELHDTQMRRDAEERQDQVPSIDMSNRGERQRSGRTYLQRISEFSPSLVLENSGSVARDHLASERTFLAYVRTSLGCAAAGVALVQLIAMTPTNVPLRLEKLGKVLGAVTEVLGVGIIIMALFRYFIMQRALINGKFPPAGMVIWTIVFAMAVITTVTFGLMLAIALS